MRRTRRTVVVVITAAASVVLAGCGANNFRDLEGVESQDPDSVTLWNNVDGHPNVVRLCLDGVAFATTSRDYEPILRVPEWDSECGGER